MPLGHSNETLVKNGLRKFLVRSKTYFRVFRNAPFRSTICTCCACINVFHFSIKVQILKLADVNAISAISDNIESFINKVENES